MQPIDDQPISKPSKRFLIRGGIATGILALILLVQTQWFLGLFSKNKDQNVATVNTTIGQVVGKDSNGNGVADWEERLWGLDPTVTTTNGVSNLAIIKQKRLDLNDGKNIQPLNETDILARSLFSVSTALGQEEGLTSEQVGVIAGKLSDKGFEKDTTARYSLKDVKTTKTTATSLSAYKTSLEGVLRTYSDTEDITTFLYGVETGNYEQFGQLDTAIDQYQKVSKKLLSMTVPVGVALYHLQIVNSIDGFTRAFYKMKSFEDNSLVGLVGFAEYRELDTKLEIATAKLLLYFEQYGIL